MGLVCCFLNNKYNTVEPPNKGHFGANSSVPCREVVPISEVNEKRVGAFDVHSMHCSKLIGRPGLALHILSGQTGKTLGQQD